LIWRVRAEGRDRCLDKAITFLMKLIENTGKLNDIVEKGTVGNQTVVLEALLPSKP